MHYSSRSTSRPRPGAAHKRPFRSNNKRSQKVLDSRLFINAATAPAEQIVYESKHQFSDFALNNQIQSTLAHIGLTTPTPIQDQTIAAALEGSDVLGLANTGTGKTAAFLLPTIEKISKTRDLNSVLILAPTRELAQQIDEEFRRFTAGQRLFSTLVVGGANIQRQIKQIQRGPNVIIGTPGRIRDLINRRVLRLQNVSTFILDEADRMCDMGFVRDIREIGAEMPSEKQTLCFSATMTRDVQTIVEEFMNDPVRVSVVQSSSNEHIEQDIIHAGDKIDKLDKLIELLTKDDFEKVIVFGETKFGVQRLADALSKDGLPAVAIHGNKSQAQRERALRSFKTGAVSILVATDVAARGLDIPNVSHVINFDPPQVYEDYVHRIGRTGRAGKAGKALTFVPHPR